MNLKKQILIQYGKYYKFCSTKEALSYLEEFKDSNISSILLSRLDVQMYLKQLLDIEIIRLAKGIDDIKLWQFIKEKTHVPSYLNKLQVDEAISLAKNIDHPYIWESIFKRADVRQYLKI